MLKFGLVGVTAYAGSFAVASLLLLIPSPKKNL